MFEHAKGLVVLAVIAILIIATLAPEIVSGAISPISPPLEPDPAPAPQPEQWEIENECDRFEKYWVDDNTESELRWYEETCGGGSGEPIRPASDEPDQLASDEPVRPATIPVPTPDPRRFYHSREYIIKAYPLTGYRIWSPRIWLTMWYSCDQGDDGICQEEVRYPPIYDERGSWLSTRFPLSEEVAR